jgi:hypothetical protein
MDKILDKPKTIPIFSFNTGGIKQTQYYEQNKRTGGHHADL